MLALFALFALLTPPARHALESRMSLHMLVQVPLLLACGALLGTGLPARARAALDRWNSHGITGLLAFALVTALLMIPRLLDLAVANFAIDAGKVLALVASGVLLQLSWAKAGLLVQAFFLGNVLPMTAAVGQAYQDSPLRLCNAYLLDDQVWVGQALVIVTVVLAIAWLGRTAMLLVARERALEPAGDLP
jgi:hypothetical protein